MKTTSFYAGDDDFERIQAEQERLAAIGIRVSKSAAIRSLILRASQIKSDAAQVTQAQPDEFETADKDIYRIVNTEAEPDAAPAGQERLFDSDTTDLVQFRDKGKIFN